MADLAQLETRLTAALRARAELEEQLTHPEVLADHVALARIGRELSRTAPLADAAEALRSARARVSDAKAMELDPGADAEMRALAAAERAAAESIERATIERLPALLLEPDPNDGRDVLIEVRPAAGGDEAGIFAGELFRGYLRYAERRGWKVEVDGVIETALGGVREAMAEVSGPGAWAAFKWEAGVHRIQRVPATESAGRIHTSTATVVVLPVADEVDFVIPEQDIRIDVKRASGHGGQGVNTTDSAVRITHLPTGIVVVCQNERSQIKNRASAMNVLKARLYERKQDEQRAEMDKFYGEKGEIGWGSQIRSYVLQPYQMVKDLRTGISTSDTQGVLDGDLDRFVNAWLRAGCPRHRNKDIQMDE